MRRALLILASLALAFLSAFALYRFDRARSLVEREPSYSSRESSSAPPTRPNILWVVWDTVRADRMSLYGAARPTTPKLDAWAKGALVFEDVVSTAHSTLPAHASMFTGLHAVQHGTHYGHGRLDDAHETLAELLRAAGYRTFLWSSNPHVSAATNFQQGFDRVAHPWDEAHRARALEIVREKVRDDRGTGMREVVASESTNEWAIKAAGELAAPTLLSWLEERPRRGRRSEPGGGSDHRPSDAPFFAFVNLMEAHRQYVPPRRLRERFLTEAEVKRSYAMDQSWPRVWSYTFGLEELTDDELRVLAGVYDACLLELDEIFATMLSALRAGGYLDDTVIVLTSDHGEHLGEQHRLDHQYTLYESALRVPLVVHYPAGMSPGRSRAPVMNFDVFPTLLELAGLALSAGRPAQSLLEPRATRVRIAEHPHAHEPPIELVAERHPEWDPTPWRVPMAAIYQGTDKLIWRGKEPSELYDLSEDPGEARNRVPTERARARQLEGQLLRRLTSLVSRVKPRRSEPVPEMSEAQRKRLRALGYAR